MGEDIWGTLWLWTLGNSHLGLPALCVSKADSSPLPLSIKEAFKNYPPKKDVLVHKTDDEILMKYNMSPTLVQI